MHGCSDDGDKMAGPRTNLQDMLAKLNASAASPMGGGNADAGPSSIKVSHRCLISGSRSLLRSANFHTRSHRSHTLRWPF